MSSSRHPVALRLERQVGGATRLLATVMALPLVDGIFPALVIAGAVSTLTGVVETGLLIFGGSATVAVILAEMDGGPREQARAILLLGLVLIPAAAIEAALAPTVQNVLDQVIFRRFAGLVILAVAAKTASARVGEYLPRPAVIIGLGLIASVQPAALTPDAVTVTTDAELVAKGAAAAGVGVAFALSIALLGPRLRGAVDIDLFRFGSSVALGVLALSVLQIPGFPTDAPIALGVLGVTALFAYDPDASVPADDAHDESSDDDDPTDEGAGGVEYGPDPAADRSDRPGRDGVPDDDPGTDRGPLGGFVDGSPLAAIDRGPASSVVADGVGADADVDGADTEPTDEAGPAVQIGSVSGAGPDPQPVVVDARTNGDAGSAGSEPSEGNGAAGGGEQSDEGGPADEPVEGDPTVADEGSPDVGPDDVDPDAAPAEGGDPGPDPEPESDDADEPEYPPWL
jgi:hypothetical protein